VDGLESEILESQSIRFDDSHHPTILKDYEHAKFS